VVRKPEASFLRTNITKDVKEGRVGREGVG
jgi:hypothetical protein